MWFWPGDGCGRWWHTLEAGDRLPTPVGVCGAADLGAGNRPSEPVVEIGCRHRIVRGGGGAL